MQRSLVYQKVLKHRFQDAKSKNSDRRDSSTDVEKQTDVTTALEDVKLSLKDVNPLSPVVLVLRRVNNLLIFFSAGKILFYTPNT